MTIEEAILEKVCMTAGSPGPLVVDTHTAVVLRDRESGFRLAPLDLRVVEATWRVARNEVPDLPDRVIATTAVAMGLPLVTRDGKIRPTNIQTIW